MKLKEYLKEHDDTAARFARKVGVTPAVICNLINKKKDTYLSVALKIEEASGGAVKPKDLIDPTLWKKKA